MATSPISNDSSSANPLQGLFGNPGAKPPSSTSAAAEDTEDRFLKLLVAQMRNQDPLNPLDNAQVTTQMAQISTVQGVESLNQSMMKLLAQFGQASPMDALGMIGRQVLVAGDTLERGSELEGAMGAGFELAAAADKADVRIVDASGQVMFTRSWEGLEAGLQLFQWDGFDMQGNPAPAGSYRIEVSASSGGTQVVATSLAPIRVLGISPGSDGAKIELAGQRAVSAEDIKAIL